MTQADPAYSVTRAKGRRGSITRQTGEGTFDPLTGDITNAETTVNVRWMVKEPTQYSRWYRANATQTDIGDVTFIVWLPDIDFDYIDQEAHIDYQNRRYEIVTSGVEFDTAFVMTAREMNPPATT